MIKTIITCDRCDYEEDMKNDPQSQKIQSGFVIIKVRDSSDLVENILAKEKCLCKKCHKSFNSWMNPPREDNVLFMRLW